MNYAQLMSAAGIVAITLQACATAHPRASGPSQTSQPSGELATDAGIPSATPTLIPTKTTTPAPSVTPSPIPLQETSEYIIRMDEALLEELSKVEGPHDYRWYNGQANLLIERMGIEDGQLQEIYRDYYNNNWTSQDILAINNDNRVFGFHAAVPPADWTNGFEGYALHSAVGAFYGFVPRDGVSPEITDWLSTYDIKPYPGHLILRIRPGMTRPQDSPRDFIAVKMGSHDIENGILNNTGMAVTYWDPEAEKMRTYVAQRRATEGSLAFRGTDVWTFRELENVFGLRRGSLVRITGSADPGTHEAAWFMILDDGPPSDRLMEEYNFTLGE